MKHNKAHRKKQTCAQGSCAMVNEAVMCLAGKDERGKGEGTTPTYLLYVQVHIYCMGCEWC